MGNTIYNKSKLEARKAKVNCYGQLVDTLATQGDEGRDKLR